MASSRNKKAALISIGIIVLAVITWQLTKRSVIRKKVEAAVNEKTKGLYNITYETLSLDELSGTLHITNIRLTPDTTMPHSSTLIRATIPSLDILGVRTPKALLTRQIEGRSVEIDNPFIEMMVDRSKTDRSKTDKNTPDPYKELSDALLSRLLRISVDSVKIVHAHLLITDKEKKGRLLEVDDLTCSLTSLLVDSTSIKDSTRLLFARYLDIRCDALRLPSADKKYQLQVNTVKFNSRDNSLSIGYLGWTPRLSEEAFAAASPVATDRYDFSLQNIRLLHIRREGLWRDRVVRIEADSLLVGKSSFKIYCDISYPSDTAIPRNPYPQQQLRKLPFEINIHRTVFTHTFIEYKEKNAKSDSAGKLQFFDGNVTIDNLTNEKKAIALNNKTTLRVRSIFLGQTHMDARLSLTLDAPQQNFSVEGDLEAMDATGLNPLTEPMGLAKLEKGHIDHLRFAFSGTDSASDGQLTFLYHDVRLSFLNHDKKGHPLKKKLLQSFMTNVVMKHSNSADNGKSRKGMIRIKRKPRESFLSFLWQSIFSGVRQTIGPALPK
jgi:hypothetical protein